MISLENSIFCITVIHGNNYCNVGGYISRLSSHRTGWMNSSFGTKYYIRICKHTTFLTHVV